MAKFQPLVMETMTKSKDGFLGVSIMCGQKFGHKRIPWAGNISWDKH